MKHQPGLLALAALVLILSLALGGGTHAGYLADVILELTCLPLLALVLWRLSEYPWTEPGTTPVAAMVFCVAVLAVPLLQVIPVPAGWPGRASAPSPFLDLANLLPSIPAWRPISVFPEGTVLAGLSLVPALTLFWAVALLDVRQRNRLTNLVIMFGALSAVYGLLQLNQGPTSPLRLYEYTNTDDAVGFFANRNHFAALLYCCLVLTATQTLASVSDMLSAPTGKQFHGASVVVVALEIGLLIALVATVALTRSRAGVALSGLAIFGVLVMTLRQRQRHVQAHRLRSLLVGVVIMGGALAAQASLYRVVERYFTDSLQEDARITFANNTLAAAKAYLPFGSGLGTFVRVYQTFEKPTDLMVNTFANHAHDDWLELALETGAVGLALAGVFIAWLLIRTMRAWLARTPAHSEREALHQMAATLIILLLLLHSVVDYPLRTMAMMALTAFLAGLLIPPPPYEAAAVAAEEGFNAWPALRSLRTELSRLRRRQRNGKPRTHATPSPSEPNETPTLPRGASPRPITVLSDQRWQAPAPWPKEWETPKSPATEASRAPPNPERVDFKSAWPSSDPAKAAPKNEHDEDT